MTSALISRFAQSESSKEDTEKMVASTSAAICVHFLLLFYGFIATSATATVSGEREVIVEGRIFNITFGSDTFNLECGPECKRKVSCTNKNNDTRSLATYYL